MTTTARRRLLALALAALATAVSIRYVVTAWRHRAAWTVHVPYNWDLGLTDFRDTAMLPNMALRRHINPYDVHAYLAVFPQAQEFNAYAPWWLTATNPLSHVTWAHATLAYEIAIAVIMPLLALPLVGQVSSLVHLAPRLRIVSWLTPLAIWSLTVVMIWAWRPFVLAVGLGNISCLLGLCCAMALIARRTSIGALCLAVAWIKPQYAIPLTLVMCVWPRWWKRAALGLGLAAFASVPATIRLSRITGGFLPLVRSVMDGAQYTGDQSNKAAIAGRIDIGALAGLVNWYPGAVATMVVGALVVIAAAWTTRYAWHTQGTRVPASTSKAIWICALAIVACFPHFHYDLTTLVLPGLLLAVNLLVAPTTSSRWWWAACACLTASCLLPGGVLGSAVPQDTVLLIGLWSAIAASTAAAIRDNGTSRHHQPRRATKPSTTYTPRLGGN